MITLCICVTAFHNKAFGATIDWKGGTSSDWNLPANWSPAHVPLSTEDVRIGVVSFTAQPTVTASTTILSLTLGTIKDITFNVNTGVILTVNGNVTQMHSSNNTSTTTNILGLGTITCTGSFYVGDTTAPPAPALGIINANVTNLTVVNLTLSNLNIGQNLVVNSTSASGTLLSIYNSGNVNNPTLNIINGTVAVGANVQMSNSAYINKAAFSITIINYPQAKNNTQLLLNPASNITPGTNATLSFGGVLDLNADGNASALLDLYGPGTVGTSTAIYSGNSSQTLYYSATGLDNSPYVYQNIGFSGSGTKTIPAGTLNIPGNWTSAGGKVDINAGTGVVFLGNTQSLSDAGSDSNNGVVFPSVTFQGTGTKTITSGKFSIASNGVLNMGGSATLAAGGNLTLISGANSSATVAALPAGTAITGNVNVQRFIKGSSTDLSKRGYRLISSAVYTGAPSGVRSFDLKYLLNDTYISGMTGGGFNSPTGTNPTLYLHREDITSNSTTFTSGNYKGISKINNTNDYDIGIQARFTTSNVADTTTNIPIGNGVLFFYRGSKADNATQTGSKVVAPYDYPEDVTFTQVGALNTGTVNVKQWFASSTNLSYTNNGSINNSTVRGYALVGNPYAATINWEKFNRNGANSSIYGGGFPAASTTPGKFWVFNPTTKQFDSYIQGNAPATIADTTTTVNPSGSLNTGDASNMIASGQGFYIRATTTGQTLSFRETAKTTAQPLAASLNKLMSVGGDLAMLSQVVPIAPKPVLRFKMVKDSINTDDVVLAFNNVTGTRFSDAYDVEDLNGNGALVSLSLISSDNIGTAIKQMQLPKTGQQSISLLADATTTGIYQLKLTRIENMPPDYEVWLKDAFTNDSLDIKNHDTYNFNIYKNNAATYGSKRFTLVVRHNPALAMHALGFNAIKTPKGSQLQWTTENELNDYLFTIHRSTDGGLSYKSLGQVQSSGIGSYAYLDESPVKGPNQYRVGIQDIKNNTVNYTAPINLIYADTATANSTVDIMVYPNPTAQMVNIKLPETVSGKNGSYTINILSSSGRVMKHLTTSQPTWQENVTTLLPGTYIIQVINNRDSKVEGKIKFVKL